MREARPAQVFAMNPDDLADAVGLVRRMQLDIIRRQGKRNHRAASAEGQAGCTQGLLLGSLLAVLGFDPVADDAAELDAGLGAAAYRSYVGLPA